MPKTRIHLILKITQTNFYFLIFINNNAINYSIYIKQNNNSMKIIKIIFFIIIFKYLKRFHLFLFKKWKN